MSLDDHKLTVLIADDEREDQEFFKFLFSHHVGFQVVGCVADGREAIEAIEGGVKPDVLLVDLHMPRMNGTEVAKYLLEKNISPNTHVYLISGTINKKHQDDFRHAERVSFLKKPCCLEEVNDIPGAILGNLGIANPNLI